MNNSGVHIGGTDGVNMVASATFHVEEQNIQPLNESYEYSGQTPAGFWIENGVPQTVWQKPGLLERLWMWLNGIEWADYR